MKSQPELTKYTKHYCCLYHFTTGKQEKSSTPCFNHVPLGIINPKHSTVARSPRIPPKNLKINSQSHQIHFHTHDLNEIQYQQSLPKRLAYPRVYVQQLNPKYSFEEMNSIAIYEAFLKKKQFQQIFELFKKISKLTGFRSQQQLIKSIKSFCRQNRISFPNENKKQPQMFFPHDAFINYLISLGFQQKQAQNFWEVAYNRSRFLQSNQKLIDKKNQVISMMAFAYNYNKFYLQQMESYKNCLSESALRQRMIDLRLFLQPWFNKNIAFKQNHQIWKEQQLQICAQIKRYGNQNVYQKMLSCIQLRNKIWLFMRTLSKIIYQVTDHKNVGLQIFNQNATALINKNKQNLQTFVQFLNHFQTLLLSSGRSKDQKFRITDLLQQAKIKFSNKIENLMCYLRGLFKYLYFFHKCPHLHLNHQSLNLDCDTIVQISFNELLEFAGYKRKETNYLMQMIQSICKEINETVDARPQISGHKKFLNQCNFLIECILKMIKRCDFSIFYRLHEARQLYKEGDIANLQKLRSILEDQSHQNKQIRKQFWKKMFTFIQIQQSPQNQSISKDEQHEKNYLAALQGYRELQSKLQGKLPFITGNKNKPNQQSKVSTSLNKKSSKIKNKDKLINQQEQQIVSIDSNCAKHICYNSIYCPLCDDLCNTSVSSSLNKVDQMSTYLMDLLRDI